MDSLEIQSESVDEALRQAAKAVYEGYAAPLAERYGAWTAAEVYEALARRDFEP